MRSHSKNRPFFGPLEWNLIHRWQLFSNFWMKCHSEVKKMYASWMRYHSGGGHRFFFRLLNDISFRSWKKVVIGEWDFIQEVQKKVDFLNEISLFKGLAAAAAAQRRKSTTRSNRQQTHRHPTTHRQRQPRHNSTLNHHHLVVVTRRASHLSAAAYGLLLFVCSVSLPLHFHQQNNIRDKHGGRIDDYQ